jgi:hypothetical protein
MDPLFNRHIRNCSRRGPTNSFRPTLLDWNISYPSVGDPIHFVGNITHCQEFDRVHMHMYMYMYGGAIILGMIDQSYIR